MRPLCQFLDYHQIEKLQFNNKKTNCNQNITILIGREINGEVKLHL